MSFIPFIKPYPDGYEDFEVGGTPVTAEILNTNYDGFLLALNEFLPELEGRVEANPSEAATAGNLTKLKVGNSIYLIPSGGSGGSTVEWEQLQITGTKIATITIDNVPVDVYAPSGGGSGDEVSWTQVVGLGTKIGTITINGTPTDVYAPTPIDVEANPSGTATAGDLTKLKVGSNIYSVPSGGSGGASNLSDLGDVTITNVQDGQIIKWNSTTSKWENVNDTGGGSGHTILDDDGTSLAQEDDLQFKGVYTADNSTDGVTEVNVYREMTKDQFDLLSADEKKGFIRVTDEPDIYSDGHFQPVIYSTEEREIGVWTDGKPLYEKTVNFGAIPNSTSKNVAHNISNLDKVVSFDGVMISSDSFETVPSGENSNFRLTANDTNINITTSANWNDWSSSFITVRYTKTTDVAGSGSWTPQGVPTHKYSTEEHVVGTYLGETLYEKTWVLENVITLTSNTWTAIPPIPKTLFSKILNCEVINNAGSYVGFIQTAFDSAASDYLRLINVRNADVGVKEITLRYTKSS